MPWQSLNAQKHTFFTLIQHFMIKLILGSAGLSINLSFVYNFVHVNLFKSNVIDIMRIISDFFFLVSTIKLNLMFIQNRFFFFILTFLFFFAVLHIYITINGIYIWTQKHEMINEANVIESMQFNTTKLSKTEELNYR